MKAALPDSRLNALARRALVCICTIAAIAAAGCAHVSSQISSQLPPSMQDLGPSYRPANVYRAGLVLPPSLRRVALLPLTSSGAGPNLESGTETLEPLVYSELEKTMRFEVVPVTRDQLKQWTGQSDWHADEQLPPQLFTKVKEATGCDAVMFCQLTRYEPYQPIAIGWKFSLVGNPHGAEIPAEIHAQILWSVDEVLDAGEPTVATGARNYYMDHLRNEAPAADPSTVLHSPARFGQYTLGTLFETLPKRAGEVKTSG